MTCALHDLPSSTVFGMQSELDRPCMEHSSALMDWTSIFSRGHGHALAAEVLQGYTQGVVTQVLTQVMTLNTCTDIQQLLLQLGANVSHRELH